MYGTTQAVIDDVNLWPGIKDQMIADLAEGIYAAGPEALTAYNTTTTDYATQFGYLSMMKVSGSIRQQEQQKVRH